MIITVPKEADGLRADVFLAGFVEEISTRSAAQKILAQNDLAKNRRVRAGEVLTVEIPAPAPLHAAAEDIPLHIVYEDSDMLVLNKPRGLVVHPAAGHHSGTLVNALLHHCELSEIGGSLRPGIVHRLDKDTSGLMVVAKNDRAHAALAAQLESREMGRTYHAICVGAVKKEKLRIDLPIGRHPRDRKKMAVYATAKPLTANAPRARNAVTNIEVLERFSTRERGTFTLIAAHLETGRTHQIRVHMAHIGHPILGDATYGAARQHFATEGQILHAKKLRLTHPASGEKLEFETVLPQYFLDALEKVKTT